MIPAIYTIFLINCLFLVLIVLMQSGKGGGMAGFGGGAPGAGSATVFGNRGAATFVQKMTIASAALFMALSMLLAYLSTTPASIEAGQFRDAPAAAPAPEALPIDFDGAPAMPPVQQDAPVDGAVPVQEDAPVEIEVPVQQEVPAEAEDAAPEDAGE